MRPVRRFPEDYQMKNEALKLALEALEGVLDDSHKVLEASISGGLYEVVQCRDAITAIKQALAAQPAVPDAIGPNEDELPAYAAGWNDCRQTMLEILKARGNT
jgi:hypothetical protein